MCRQNLEEGHFLQKETTTQSSVEWKVNERITSVAHFVAENRSGAEISFKKLNFPSVQRVLQKKKFNLIILSRLT